MATISTLSPWLTPPITTLMAFSVKMDFTKWQSMKQCSGFSMKQLCDQMIFNHDPPRCFGCEGCGGETRCGGMCSALVATNEGGYDVCRTIGRLSTANVALIDVENPGKGVILNMSSSQSRIRCSLTVSVNCDPSNAQIKEFPRIHTPSGGWVTAIMLLK